MAKYTKVLTQVVIDKKLREFVDKTRRDNRNLSTAEVIRWSIDTLQDTPFVAYERIGGKFSELITNSVVTQEQYDFIVARANEKHAGNLSAAVRDAIVALQFLLTKEVAA